MNNTGLRLIGAAFPRTGTVSVAKALERLGLGPCYSMFEVFRNPQHTDIWNATIEGILPDWNTFFAGYTCTLDTPACLFWRELAECFPRAKVLLLRRDPERWYDSMYATVYQVTYGPKGETDVGFMMLQKLFFETYLDGKFEDKAYTIQVYRQYCEEVKNSVESPRLLDYKVSKGWEPLCEFLGYDRPAEPFPRINTQEEFITHCRARGVFPEES